MIETIGGYQIVRPIGCGAMGRVYLARDPHIGRLVALKTINDDLLRGENRADYLQRFAREGRAVGRCTHANIVQVYHYFEVESRPHIVMEFVDGPSFDQVLKTRKSRPEPLEAVGFGLALLEGLAHAHGHKIVHRDIKPANILIGPSGPKITDFGIARILDAEATEIVEIGTLAYMAPEQITAVPEIDGRADLYSAGVVLFEYLTGRRPFMAANTVELRMLVCSGPRTLATDLPQPLAVVLQKALAADREARYQTAEEFAAALRAAGEVRTGSASLIPEATPTEAATVPLPARQTGAARQTGDAVETPVGSPAIAVARIPMTEIVDQRARARIVDGLRTAVPRHTEKIVANILAKAHSVEEMISLLAKYAEGGSQGAQIERTLSRIAADAGLARKQAERAQRYIPKEVQDMAKRYLARTMGGRAPIIVRRIADQSRGLSEFHEAIAGYLTDRDERARYLSEAEREG